MTYHNLFNFLCPHHDSGVGALSFCPVRRSVCPCLSFHPTLRLWD